MSRDTPEVPTMSSTDDPVCKDYWSEAVFTLVGHATTLHEQGQTDFPNWFFDLAINLSRTHLDHALAERIAKLKLDILISPPQNEVHGE